MTRAPVDYDELRRLAEAATVNPRAYVAGKNRAADAAFYHAASPATILAILDDVTALVEALGNSAALLETIVEHFAETSTPDNDAALHVMAEVMADNHRALLARHRRETT